MLKSGDSIAGTISGLRTPEDVKRWCKRLAEQGSCPMYEGWPDDLFALERTGYTETIGYLTGRFSKTDVEEEYYACIPYLTCNIPPDDLFVPWTDSANLRLIQPAASAVVIDEIGIAVSKKNKPMKTASVLNNLMKTARAAPMIQRL